MPLSSVVVRLQAFALDASRWRWTVEREVDEASSEIRMSLA